MTNVSSMVCWRSTPRAHLNEVEKQVLRTLHDARGFFKSSGLSIADVMKRLGLKSAKDAELVEVILYSMERTGLAKRLPSGNWRRS